MEISKKTSRDFPNEIVDASYSHAAFCNGEVLLHKKNGRLPAMGWNSWNAFGSNNTEDLTKAMADAIVDLGLDKLGYEYIVLDDGCYKSQRVDGRLANEQVKFPHDFSVLADYIHDKGLKFGMYNDIGTNLCAGSEVGTCGFEDVDAKSYIDWKVDFLKVDNCYYLWDNATFSNPNNAKYSYAPNIKSIQIRNEEFSTIYNAIEQGKLLGNGGIKHRNGYVTNIGTYDGTNVGITPTGNRSSELAFFVTMPSEGEYEICVEYATGKEIGIGAWLQIAVGKESEEIRYFDGMLPETEGITEFRWSTPIKVALKKGENIVRVMNHRRQENVLNSYATLLAGLNDANPNHDVLLSICEWGKTQPHEWGYKVGSSWRILNDITFMVGADGNPGMASWEDSGTPSITSQYDKCVIMDEYAGLDRGWNDPDMLVIGMNGITMTMCRTHMAMWCMMNAPLMLGLDLRRLTKGDEYWKMIANEDLIALNQDALGIQAKRIYCSLEETNPDTEYITNHDRVDVLAKPLSNGDIALSFINLSEKDNSSVIEVSVDTVIRMIGRKMTNAEAFQKATSYRLTDLWSKESLFVCGNSFSVHGLEACGNKTYRISIG